jgi:hypothetical protein
MTREWNGSQVMEEFAKIAAESGLITTDLGDPIVGNTDKKTPVEGHRRHEPGKEYSITKETGEELVGEAHPDDATLAESMGEGGLVENIVQQQEKDIEVATRMPSGALFGKHAELVNGLIALANSLEDEGKTEAAVRVDHAIGRITRFPFGGDFHKEAWAWPFMTALLAPLKWILWGGAAGGTWYTFGAKLTSLRESLSDDIGDLIEVADSVGEGQPAMSALVGNLRAILMPYTAKFRQPIPVPGQEAELRQYLADLDHFGQDLAKVSSIIGALAAVPDEWYKFGLGAKSRLKEKLSDVQKTFSETMAAVKGMAEAGQKKMEAGPDTPRPEAAKTEIPSDIAGIQALLAENGMKIPQTGVLDDATKEALQRLESQIDANLRRDPETAEILKRRRWNVSGVLLHPDGTVISPDMLRRLLSVSALVVAKT